MAVLSPVWRGRPPWARTVRWTNGQKRRAAAGFGAIVRLHLEWPAYPSS